MTKLQTMESVVLEVLEENPIAREDDYLLLLSVCERLKLDILNYPFWLVIKCHKVNGLPNWKTIERCRRKIQRERPDLVSPKAAKARAEEEAEYIDYSRNAS